MRATLLLAEAATTHPDGTTSMLRAGIDRVWSKEPPVPLRGVLFVRIESDMGDSGPHQLDLRCMDEDGREALPKVDAQFQVPQGGGVSTILLGMSVRFAKYGRYHWVLRVDNVQQDTWKITVAAKPAEKGPAKGSE